MTSRLDRLYHLLESGGQPAVRAAAAHQIGELAKSLPQETPRLLDRLARHLRSRNWDTRVAAGLAVQAISAATAQSTVGASSQPTSRGVAAATSQLLTFDELDFEKIVRTGARLLSSDVEAMDETGVSQVERAALESRLGLDNRVSSHLGGLDGIEETDLQLVRAAGAVYSTMSVERAVEYVRQDSRNRKRTAAAAAAAAAASAEEEAVEESARRKVLKLEKVKEEDVDAEVDAKAGVDDVASATQWVFADFADSLIRDMWHQDWEVRHGVAVGLRELLRHHRREFGRSPSSGGLSEAANLARHRRCVEDLCLRLLCTLALDQLSDFVSDEVIAPVRETCGQVLGVLSPELAPDQLACVIDSLLCLSRQPHWMISYGGLLGIKYILASRTADAAELLPRVYDQVFHHIANAKDDDVMASAVSTLVPVGAELCRSLPERLPQLMATLWSLLCRLDDLTPAANTVLSLLTALQLGGVSPDQFSDSELAAQQQTLLPFLYDPLRSVRETASRALAAFASRRAALNRLTPACLADILRQLYQRCLLEELPDTRAAVRDAWDRLLADPACSRLLPAALTHADNLAAMLELACQPSRQEYLETAGGRFVLPQRRAAALIAAGAASLHIGGASSLSESAERRESVVLEARIFAVGMLGGAAAAAAKTTGNDVIADVERLGEKMCQVMSCYLSGKLATQRFVGGTFCASFAATASASIRQGHRAVAIPTTPANQQALRDLLVKCLGEVVYYEESLLHFKQMQADCRALMAAVKEAGGNCLGLPAAVGPVLSLETCKSLVGPVSAKLTPELRAHVASQLGAASVSVERCAGLIGLLNMRVQSSLASALCLLTQELPDRVSPVVKPLMDSLKAEENEKLQLLSANALARALLALSSKPAGPTVCDKVVKNLSSYLRAVEQQQQQQPQLLTTRPLATDDIVAMATGNGAAPVATAAAAVESRGGEFAFQAACRLFGDELEAKLAPLWRLAFQAPVEALANTESLDSDGMSALLTSLATLEVCSHHFEAGVFEKVSASLIPLFSRHPGGPLSSPDPRLRHALARLASRLAVRSPGARTRTVQLCLDWIGHAELPCRLGGAELAFLLVRDLDLLILPYLSLLLLPSLARMSDQCQSVRAASAKTFGRLLRLLPLEEAAAATVAGADDGESPRLPSEMLARREAERGFIDCLLHPSRAVSYAPPVAVKAQLRSYQQEGVNWLVFLRRYGLNGVLADDLGLGKTLMTICALAGEHRERLDRFESSGKPSDCPLPSLVICPATLMGHWLYEMEKFIEDASAQPLVISGNRQVRKAQVEKFARTHRRAPLKSGCTVVITSFDAVRKDLELFSEIEWNYCILDEGHIIKNPKSKLSLAVKSLKCQHRLVLTGTPIQNGVHELWAIFDFLMPGYLGTEAEFSSAFTKPIQASRDAKASAEDQSRGSLALEALHRQTLPFMLRRLKEDVLRDLPPKICQDYYCQLSPLQAQLYEKFCRNSSLGAGQGNSPQDCGSESRQHIFQALHFLRKICNHPALALPHQSDAAAATVENSGKFVALCQLLSDIGVTGESRCGVLSQHRVLIFAQTKATLDLVERLVFRDSDMVYLRLDGSVPVAERHGLVVKFNSDPSIDALLLTTAVGGLGLNLTGADTVIFVDHDWNPMKDLQAMDRAHRIGQTRSVSVYRLLTRDTIEEKIMKYQKFKTAVANTVVNADNANLDALGTEQLLDLFEFSSKGAAASAGKDKDSAAKLRAKQSMSKTLGSMLSSATASAGLEASGNEFCVDYEEEFDMTQFVSMLT